MDASSSPPPRSHILEERPARNQPVWNVKHGCKTTYARTILMNSKNGFENQGVNMVLTAQSASDGACANQRRKPRTQSVNRRLGPARRLYVNTGTSAFNLRMSVSAAAVSKSVCSSRFGFGDHDGIGAGKQKRVLGRFGVLLSLPKIPNALSTNDLRFDACDASAIVFELQSRFSEAVK
jgi:hypothetical protein